jgi:NAD-dependent SIR2 family protein deacetylase
MNTQISEAKKLIDQSDALLISASNGLSIAEGYNIFADDDNFEKYFGHFNILYGINSLIQGVFTQIPTPDHQEFMRKVHQYLIDDYQKTEIFAMLKQIINNKDYFVVTSNADTHFQLNGFNPEKIFEIEGNFDQLEMQSPQWKKQKQRFDQFINEYADRKVVQLELGIGSRNKLIKQPLMKVVSQLPSWNYVTLNMENEIMIAPEIKSRSIALPGNIETTFKDLLKEN